MAVRSLSRLRGRAGGGCLTGTPALAEAFPHPDRIFDAIRPPPQAPASGRGAAELAEPDDSNSRIQKRADLRAREGRPGLDFSPPFADAGMFVCRDLMRRDLLVDPLDEGDGRDIRDRIGLADQPARWLQRL